MPSISDPAVDATAETAASHLLLLLMLLLH